MIEVQELCFRYPTSETRVLDGLSLSITPGEHVAILAANGGGKTTLARWLAGLFPEGVVRAEHGQVNFDGQAWPKWSPAARASAVQFVGQVPAQQLSGAAFTVADEIAFGPCNLGLPAAEVRERVAQALSICRLGQLTGRDPFTLSGGEQQRLAIGAALAMRPRVLVLDEPTSNLDPESRGALIAQLAALPADLTVIICEVTLAPCLAFARRFMLLDGGRIIADGSAAAVLAHPRCVALLGQTAVTDAAARVQAAGLWPADVALPLTAAAAIAAFREAQHALRR